MDVVVNNFNVDFDAPVIANRIPAPAAVGVIESTNIDFDLLDDTGVDLATLDIDVDGVPAVVGGVAQTGFALTTSVIVGGVHVTVNPDVDFASADVVPVSVTVSDTSTQANELVSTWSFATDDTVAPVIGNLDPAPAATGVDKEAVFGFRVTDTGGTGIGLASLDVTLTWGAVVHNAVVNGVVQPGFSMTTTPVSGGYDVVLDVDGDMDEDTVHTVYVYVEDLGGNSDSETWSFQTALSVIETPRLTAHGRDGSVVCVWQVNELMTVIRYDLRRSTSSPPAAPGDGELVYTGGVQSHVDYDVVSGTRYYYTVFVVYDLSPLSYVPYDQLASDDAVPFSVSVTERLDPEYIPAPGELGKTRHPFVPGAKLLSSWGKIVDGRRVSSDVWRLARGMVIFSPVSGTVASAVDGEVVIDTGNGIRVTFQGRLRSTRGQGAVEPGDPVAVGAGGAVTLAVSKLPTGSFGRRSIRPSYIYLARERRL